MGGGLGGEGHGDALFRSGGLIFTSTDEWRRWSSRLLDAIWAKDSVHLRRLRASGVKVGWVGGVGGGGWQHRWALTLGDGNVGGRDTGRFVGDGEKNVNVGEKARRLIDRLHSS